MTETTTPTEQIISEQPEQAAEQNETPHKEPGGKKLLVVTPSPPDRLPEQPQRDRALLTPELHQHIRPRMPAQTSTRVLE